MECTTPLRDALEPCGAPIWAYLELGDTNNRRQLNREASGWNLGDMLAGVTSEGL